MQVKKAIIPAAGLGTRFLPVTKSLPKEMLPLIDKPILQFIIEEIVGSGIQEILIVTTRDKASIENHFDRNIELEVFLKERGKLEALEEVQAIAKLAKIYFLRQDAPKGLGHAVSICKDFIGQDPFALLLGDEVFFSEKPALKQLLEVHEETGGSVLCVGQVPQNQVSRYGIVDYKKTPPGARPQVQALVEKPSPQEAPSNSAIFGRYILSPRVFHYLEEIKPGRGGEYQLTDALDLLLKEEPIYTAQIEGQRFDVGSQMGYLTASLQLALDNPAYREEVLDFLRPHLK
ncbi:MAG: UTP--glucose-1-phosphate uridylyltransferase GalU [Tissierellia bacterium]|nr:UTP--glucose-1-phosphate uridylyltransferase GalU [Tissierellia bacterium]